MKHVHFRYVIACAFAVSCTALIAGAVPAVAVAIASVVIPAWRRIRRTRLRQTRIVEELPDTIELLVVLIRAGLTPVQATKSLVLHAPPSWQPAFVAVQHAREHGKRFVDALDELAVVAGPPGRLVVDALAASERFGQPLMPSLERLSFEGRAARRRHNETKARQLPVRLSFPLVCCTLPAFVLLCIAPLLAGALGSITRQGGAP